MYNCIILFISFYFVPFEKKLKAFFLLKLYNNLGIGPGFCSQLKLSFLAIVI